MAAMSQAAATRNSTITCRRCRRGYVLARTILPACPHCGAAPVPLRIRFRHNGIAAIVALIALITLCVADVIPFISMTRLGEVREYSLISGIIELFKQGNWLIGAVLLAFSVIFPFAKLLALLIATSSLAPVSSQS